MKLSSLLGAGALGLTALTQCAPSEKYSDDRLGVVVYEEPTSKDTLSEIKIKLITLLEGESIGDSIIWGPYTEWKVLELDRVDQEEAPYLCGGCKAERFYRGKVVHIVTKNDFLIPAAPEKNKRDDIKENTPFFGH